MARTYPTSYGRDKNCQQESTYPPYWFKVTCNPPSTDNTDVTQIKSNKRLKIAVGSAKTANTSYQLENPRESIHSPFKRHGI